MTTEKDLMSCIVERNEISSRLMRVKLRMGGETPLWVCASCMTLKQILLNLNILKEIAGGMSDPSLGEVKIKMKANDKIRMQKEKLSRA